jgi:hypothetical protein
MKLNKQRRLQVGKCIRQFSAPDGKVRANSQAFLKSSATRADRQRARQRSEVATSRWRTALRDYKIIQNDDSSWAVIHWSGTIVGKFDDAVAASAALAN